MPQGLNSLTALQPMLHGWLWERLTNCNAEKKTQCHITYPRVHALDWWSPDIAGKNSYQSIQSGCLGYKFIPFDHGYHILYTGASYLYISQHSVRCNQLHSSPIMVYDTLSVDSRCSFLPLVYCVWRKILFGILFQLEKINIVSYIVPWKLVGVVKLNRMQGQLPGTILADYVLVYGTMLYVVRVFWLHKSASKIKDFVETCSL